MDKMISSIDEGDGQQLLSQCNSNFDVKVHHTPKVSSIPSMRTPSTNNVLYRVLFDSLNAWESTSKHEEYRFASIMTANENVQVSFEHYQLVPVLRSIPGVGELINRT
jgi:hypothetical protein